MVEGVVVLIPEDGMFGQVMESGRIKPEEGESRPYPAEHLVFVASDSDGCDKNLGIFVEHDHTLASTIRQLAKFFWDMIMDLCTKSNRHDQEIVGLKKRMSALEAKLSQHVSQPH